MKTDPKAEYFEKDKLIPAYFLTMTLRDENMDRIILDKRYQTSWKKACALI